VLFIRFHCRARFRSESLLFIVRAVKHLNNDDDNDDDDDDDDDDDEIYVIKCTAELTHLLAQRRQ